jgi:hypothetical protein
MALHSLLIMTAALAFLLWLAFQDDGEIDQIGGADGDDGNQAS